MSRIGILCPGAIGHLNPMCNLGIELLRRGHKVILFGVPEVEEKISQSNLEFSEIGGSDFPLGSIETMYAQLGQLTGLSGLKFAIQFFKKEAIMLFRDAPNAIRNAQIDFLIVDQVTSAGGTIADYLNLPFITVCNALPINKEPGVPPYFTHWRYKNVWWAKLRNQLGNVITNYLSRSIWDVLVQQRKAWHLPPHYKRDDSYSKLAQISQLPQELDFPRQKIVPWFHYAGPLRNPSDIEPVSLNKQHFSFELLNGKPLIYANLGTLQNQNLKIFRCIAEACLDIDAQLVISLGNPKADVSKADFPGNPIVVAFPPHQQLINRSHLVITHAGSTAVSCLSSGVPMVAIPITTDQPGMAARVAQAGAGEVVPLAKLNVPKLKTAIKRVLEDRTYRDNAAKLCSAIQDSGGVCYAADVIEQVIHTRSPALNKRLRGCGVNTQRCAS
ncbi:glycosyl transferase family 1 [Hassallia byssoidea VB512170]|uniref:Glycosyl transferase family 1 n=1 Tax=Hassallia byssoidea VB512170 TaxID=1304833 RepID=A0A846H8W3_9CYAN|nr:nucleotide disphospho-sugar-binding domain-containing protein [Hassalia byssoidea]NEU73806.1 glycosyl transferase family 1 [Hassalia byssoidea VB512170]